LGGWVWEKQEPLKTGRRAGKDIKRGRGKKGKSLKKGRGGEKDNCQKLGGGKGVKKSFLPGKILGGYPPSTPLVNFTFRAPEMDF
jgi:hypothetical protein